MRRPTVRAGGGVAGISSTAPAFTGAPGVYFCSAPETRAALSAWTRISCPWVNFLPSTVSVGGADVSRPFDLDLLHEAAGVAERLEPPLLHLSAEVRRRNPLVAGAARTPVQRIAREELHVAPDGDLSDGRRRRRSAPGRRVDCAARGQHERLGENEGQ